MRCSLCGIRRPAPGRVQCVTCNERAKVRQHQLHKRRSWYLPYRNHACRLCLKYSLFVKELKARWDERGAWVLRRCRKGHEIMEESPTKPCQVCAWEIGQEFLRKNYPHLAAK